MNDVLPIVLYVLGSILLVILIILGVKLITLVDKMNKTIDDINTKIDSFNGLFQVIDLASNKFAVISDKVTEGVASLVKKVVY